MDNWPVSLQQKLDADGFNLRFGDTRVATEMDVGMAKVRSRYTDAIDIYDAVVRLDFTEIATFKTFYKTTLSNGTLPFLFVDPTTEVESAFRFAPGVVPQIRPLGGRIFVLTMVWEKIP